MPASAEAADPAVIAGLRAREQAENFPVALRLLPRDLRRHLRAVYDVARVIDELGDEADGDRTRLLEDFDRDLVLAWQTGEPSSPVLRRLVPTLRELRLDRALFARLVQANLQDQRVTSYPTYGDLLGYCRFSADPVGRIVLAIFGVDDRGAPLLSDRVCTALQLLEFWQDVAEDRRAGRVYLPQEDLRAYGVTPSHLDATTGSPGLRRLLAFEVQRAAGLLEQGTPLVGRLHGWARVAVAGYVAGGRATAAALRAADFDVMGGPPRPRRRDIVRETCRLLVNRS